MIRHRRRSLDPFVLAAAISVAAVALLISVVVVILVHRAPVPIAAPSAVGLCGDVPTSATRELRGMTVTTVRNTDFPSRPGLPADQVRAEFLGWLDLAVAQRHNAIFVQVKPSGDAFWDSEYAPWSEWLTGDRSGASPGWDPMEFMISESHKRNIEFYAWVMPYFGSAVEGAGGQIAALAPDHELRRHPEWAVVYPDNSGERLWYNPGIPEARRFIEDSILEAVTRYDVDGIFFDDYFYPYPRSGYVFDDAATYARYGSGLSLADWRRSNVDTLVREMSERIKQIKPWVKFGISPFGIWRNASNDPEGSQTNGLSAYDAIYADSRKWVREQWVDFIVPQLYWTIGNPPADYKVLVPWWSKQIEGTRVQLYIGHGDHNIGRAGAWSDPAEISRQMTLNEDYPVTGDMHFTAHYVRDDPLGAVTRYRDDHYADPALPPVMAQLPNTAPGAPVLTGSTVEASGAVTLRWRPASGSSPWAYAVYRYGPGDTAAPLVAVVHAPGTGEVTWSQTPGTGGPYRYCVSGLDRSWNEGPTVAAPSPG